MKPLHKVVTAADVQSCLYYVHVDAVDDYGLRKPVPAHQPDMSQNGGTRGSEGGALSLGGSELRRKPIPILRERAIEDQPQLRKSDYPLLPLSNNQKGVAKIGRKPIAQEADSMPKVPPPSVRPSVPHPFGPRSMRQRYPPVESNSLEKDVRKQNLNPRATSEQPPTLLRRPLPSTEEGRTFNQNHHPVKMDSELSNLNSATDLSHQGDSLPWPITPSNGIKNETSLIERQYVSLTLIRRYGGSQWNVGKIIRTFEATDLRRENKPESTPAFDQSESGLYVDILNPGYEKFTNQASRSNKKSPLQKEGPNGLDVSQKREVTRFRRQIQNTNRAKRKQKSESPLDKHGFRPNFNFRRDSHEKAGRSYPDPSPVDQSKGYTFQSPWNGTCEFNIGLANRSLRCKHIINSSHAPVSELRFNLPSSSKPPSNSHASWPPSSSSSSKRSSFLPTKHNHPSPRTSEEQHHRKKFSTDDDEEEEIYDDERMDLSLGQEHAGGGFRGKEAKLGKLIVENEGLKMLDLVVGANIGIWWGVYERCF